MCIKCIVIKLMMSDVRYFFTLLMYNQKKHGYKLKRGLLKMLEDKLKQKLLLRLSGRGSLREKRHGRHCYR